MSQARSAMRQLTITHTIEGGFCSTCGETLEWLESRGALYSLDSGKDMVIQRTDN
jgi:hypothetical protein